jgi:hypothetical protein
MTIDTAHRADISVASAARDEANRYRARWILKVVNRDATIFDVIVAAKQPYGDALAKIRLNPLLALDPAVGRHRKQLIKDVVARTHVGKSEPTKISIGWLIRSEVRYAYFVEAYLAFANVTDAPTDRFPWVC